MWERYGRVAIAAFSGVIAMLLYGLLRKVEYGEKYGLVPKAKDSPALHWALTEGRFLLTLGVLVALCMYLGTKESGTGGAVAEESRQRMREAQLSLETALQSEDRALTLGQLWALTQDRLDIYHHIVTTQARESFHSAQRAMAAGFVLLVGFVVVAASVDSTAVAAVAGGLGAVAAAMAAFVSRTFVKSQETAAEHLRTYFTQPMEFARYLAAERLLADPRLPEDKRAEVVGAIAEAIVTGPPPLAEAGADFLGQVPKIFEGGQK